MYLRMAITPVINKRVRLQIKQQIESFEFDAQSGRTAENSIRVISFMLQLDLN